MEAEVITDCDGQFDTVHEGAKLTYQQRKALPDSAFCLVYSEKGKSGKMLKRRRFPAQDAAHVRNGLARLPQAKNLSPAQKSKVRNCLVKRAKKHGVKVAATLITESYTQRGDVPDGHQAVVANDDGTFTVMSGMEGQKVVNAWTREEFTLGREYFESTYKKYKGKFFYPGHENKLNVEKRLARIVESTISDIKVKGKTRTALFHKIKPRTEAIAHDIENGYYDDVSLDTFNSIFSDDDESLIVDGEPHGVAFVGAFGNMKGCPICKVVHNASLSCLEASCDCQTDSSMVSADEIKEAETLSEEEQDAQAETSTPPAAIEGVTGNELEAMQAQIEELKFGNAVEALATKIGTEKDAMMAIVSSKTTPDERLAGIQALAEKFEEEKKEIVKSKLLEDEASVGKPLEEPGEYSQSQFEATLAEMEGRSVPSKKEGDE